MNELIITFKENYYLENGEKSIGIFVNSSEKEDLLYKFLVGHNGMWKIIKDFTEEKFTLWDEKEEGNYIIMIQAKRRESSKPFDYVARMEYIIKHQEIDEDDNKGLNKTLEYFNNFIDNKKNKEVKLNNIESNDIKEEELNLEGDENVQSLVIEESGNEIESLANMEVAADTNFSEGNTELIKHVLVYPKDKHFMDEEIVFNILTENIENVLVKYKIYIDENLVEEIEYCQDKNFSFFPRCIGTYRFEFYAKHMNSNKKFDEVREHVIDVQYSRPIESVEIKCDKNYIRCNEDATFTATSVGGKNVLYEFYILMENRWELAQRYSKKSYYTMMPFKKGEYIILVLAKSFHKNVEYENYGLYKFNSKPGKELVVQSYAFV
ncbi:triple tyrosine motif-containing protein [Hathewaya histolytica]|uniref:Triple tyrosine motif-containing protein n=1 Tax=Hathewaya histolytica TaxID=1498 RepID=A0A4U9R5G1_HATHI|nr:triple tyrosine motif-containing protein [Hathewaya histolytica]VTQ85293.1 triple tyrosine motif-containing protein [Hathewaya histolytica]